MGADVFPTPTPTEPTPSPTDLALPFSDQDSLNKRQSMSPQSPFEAPPSPIDLSSDVTGQPLASAEPEGSLPTPNSTPQKPKDLNTLSELADRYLAKTSTAEAIEYTNPQKFCLKPAFWKKWTPKQYALLAEYARNIVDLVPFAKQTGIPVEEAKNVFSVLVCNHLYDVKEATKRGEEGMLELMEFYEKFGTPNRPWGKTENGAERVVGELHGVAPSSIKIILVEGSKSQLDLSDLSDVDIKYLGETLTVKDRRILWQDNDVE